jgi:hypothetical protein
MHSLIGGLLLGIEGKPHHQSGDAALLNQGSQLFEIAGIPAAAQSRQWGHR